MSKYLFLIILLITNTAFAKPICLPEPWYPKEPKFTASYINTGDWTVEIAPKFGWIRHFENRIDPAKHCYSVVEISFNIDESGVPTNLKIVSSTPRRLGDRTFMRYLYKVKFKSMTHKTTTNAMATFMFGYFE